MEGAGLSMHFRVVGPIRKPQTFATGNAIREIARLRRIYGPGRWRKRKGEATVRFPNGTTRLAEVHWYEATGTGQFEHKIKQFLD
jgi:hypothetical protein